MEVNSEINSLLLEQRCPNINGQLPSKKSHIKEHAKSVHKGKQD